MSATIPVQTPAEHKHYTGDCTVRCVANALGIGYQMARRLLIRFGDLDPKGKRGGTTYYGWFAALKELDRRTTKNITEVGIPAKTVRTLMRVIDPEKTYMVMIYGHVFAIVKGTIPDWIDETRLHHIKNLWVVTDK